MATYVGFTEAEHTEITLKRRESGKVWRFPEGKERRQQKIEINVNVGKKRPFLWKKNPKITFDTGKKGDRKENRTLATISAKKHTPRPST